MSDNPTGNPIDEVLARAMTGDREAMAAFIFYYEDRIRRRLRGKLSPLAKSIFDTQDVFAQVVANVDQYLADGHLSVDHEEQLWKLIWTVGERIVWRQNELAGRPCPTGPAAGEKAPAAIIEVLDDLEAVVGAARREDDREMLDLFMRGLTPSAIAKVLGASPQAIWKRWERLRKRMQGQESGVRSQESGVRSQESGAYHPDRPDFGPLTCGLWHRALRAHTCPELALLGSLTSGLSPTAPHTTDPPTNHSAPRSRGSSSPSHPRHTPPARTRSGPDA